MRVILLLFLTIALTLVPAAAQRAAAPVKQDTATYIGLRYGPTLPPGLKWMGGGLVSAVGDAKG